MADIRLQQKQALQFSAQQILSSQLLQLPMQNLEERIYEELQENPFLELVEEQKESVGDGAGEIDRSAGDDMFDSLERFSKSSLKERSDVSPSGETSEGRINFTHESPSKERFFQAVHHDSFHDTLLKQLALHEDVKEREVKIALRFSVILMVMVTLLKGILLLLTVCTFRVLNFLKAIWRRFGAKSFFLIHRVLQPVICVNGFLCSCRSRQIVMTQEPVSLRQKFSITILMIFSTGALNC